MSEVIRIFVEKKDGFNVLAKQTLWDIRHNLGMKSVEDLRYIVRYDLEGLTKEEYDKAKTIVLSEPNADVIYEETLPVEDGWKVFAMEYLPGQYDQRGDSAEQCVQLLTQGERCKVLTARVIALKGNITDEELVKVEEYLINPVESRLASLEKPKTLDMEIPVPENVKRVEGFNGWNDDEMQKYYDSMGFAMTLADLKFCRDYFRDTEHRDPSVTELRVIDTYWSDHCRHTTFLTRLEEIEIEKSALGKVIEDALGEYYATRDEVYGKDTKRIVSLMDMALIGMKSLKKKGLIPDLDESEEINACSIQVPVTIDGKTEQWLVQFKNETHNHPTEIEPFGGAATCLGGAIRDPLSGRSYVYQAMRVTGSGDPTIPFKDTMHGKLPSRKITTGAAQGYSSYGNQIGLATGQVTELYDQGYVAKRMEIGAVIGASPKENVIRETPLPDDVIVLLGGRTGRDGCGGATGSSKAHNSQSIDTCGAEVQKGNAPTERKLQRLFRRPEVSSLIKKCNDFGAGGVSVAIGELADGLQIYLDKVPKKYAGLDGTEIAISESQERMAVVVDPADVEEFLKYAREENLEAVEVAVVTETPRLVLIWRDKEIVNISRAFLDTNGAHQETNVFVEIPSGKDNYFAKESVADVKEKWLEDLADLNGCSQKGLVEMFDSSIGAGSVLMPYGGKYQLTETQAMVAKLPVLKGKTDTVTMMAYGFDPYLSSWSPYHGAVYAVLESVAKIVAGGGDYKKIRLTFQEYFRRMSEDPKRWSQPFAALLGSYEAQLGFRLPSIGGKDSMSGTFNEIDVPPTLVSFAVDVASDKTMISPELKKAGNKLVLFQIEKDAYDLPVYEQVKDLYGKFFEDVKAGKIVSAYTLDGKGVALAVSRMAFGNGLGVQLNDTLEKDTLFAPGFGDLVAEVPAEEVDKLTAGGIVIGEVTDTPVLAYKDVKITLDEALEAWKGTLEKVFKTVSGEQGGTAFLGEETVSDGPTAVFMSVKPEDKDAVIENGVYKTKNIYVCKHKVAQPRVFIPVFPGTNCEYDSTKAFERAGAEVDVKVFKNLTAEDIRDSVEIFEKAINQAQIIMFPGGFSAGDEPDGSAKFFATAFQNAKLKEAVTKLLEERDGLALGICNGFQALIKLGLVPYGAITGQKEDSPTLTFNTINRHISKMVYTKVVSNKSPWLQLATPGATYCNPASHGEGRFVAPKEWIERLFANGQVATQYVTPDGELDINNEEWNVNGSYMAIEGITSPDGRVLGKMAHSERRGESVAINIYGEQDLKIFESGVKYFK